MGVDRGTLIFLSSFFCVFCTSFVGAETIRVASYNVENYLVMDRMVSGRWQEEYTKGTHFKYAAWLTGQEEGEQRHLALLSKIPFSSIDAPKDLSFKYFEGRRSPSRGLMEAEFNTGGTKWSLFNLHLKSKWTERPDDLEASIRREKEARVIRDYIRAKYPPYKDPNYVVLGDFNDHKNSAPLRRFLQVNNSTLTQMVQCRDQEGHFWTHYWDKQDSYSRFDYLLASPELFKKLVPDSARIGGFHLCLLGSDHRIVFADFEF